MRHDLQHGDVLSALAQGCAEAVGTGVAAADDHHMLAFGGDVVDRLDTVHATCGVRQELHGEMDTLEPAAWNLHVTRHGGADGNHHCVVAGTQVIPGDVLADFHAGAEHGAFGFHLLDSAVDEALVEFEVRNAITHQTTDGVITLVYDHGVAGTGELLGAGETGWAGTDHGNGLVGQTLRRQRLDVVKAPCLIDDGAFVVLNHRGRLMDAKHAGGFAQCRADATGHFGEVVGFGQTVVRVLPLLLTDQIVELRNDVAERASAHAERGSAIHAAGRLLGGPGLQAGFGVNVEPVLDSLFNGAFGQFATGTDLQESTRISHVSALLP